MLFLICISNNIVIQYYIYMKFGQLLSSVAIPEWRLCYLNYELLKNIIDLIAKAFYIIDKEKIKLSSSDLSKLNQIILASNKHFFRLYKKQIFLTFAFVQYKIISLMDRKSQFILLVNSIEVGNELFLSSIENLYIQTNYLGELLKINLQGQRKILKKHKKTMQKLKLPYPKKIGGIIERMEPIIQQLKDQSQELYVSKSTLVSKQSRINIRQLLLVQHSSSFASFFFRMGVGVAACIVGVIVALLTFAKIQIDSDPFFVRDFHVFRGNLLLIIYLWMFSFNIYTFQKFHINYKLIFNINTHETSSHMFSRNSIITAAFIILLLTWVIQRVTDLSFFMVYFGGISWLITCTYFIIPISFWNWRGRFYMLKLIGKALISPITGVDFPIIWLTDQVVSLVTCFKDLAYTICYYSVLDLRVIPTTYKNICSAGANIYVVFFVGMFVFTWRMIQCIRQGISQKAYFCKPYFLNTLKYLTSLITLTLSFVYSAANPDIFPLWCVFSVLSAVYSYCWDLKMDWGFFQKGTRNRFLRDDLAYGSPAIYYLIIVLNFVLRLSWILTLSPNIVNSFHVRPVVFTLITGTLEIIRRAIWNILRIQKQHIANCQRLQAIKNSQVVKILQIEVQSSTRLGINDVSDRQAREERNNNQMDHVHKLIGKKKLQTEIIVKFIRESQRQIKRIETRCQN